METKNYSVEKSSIITPKDGEVILVSNDKEFSRRNIRAFKNMTPDGRYVVYYDNHIWNYAKSFDGVNYYE